MANSCIARTRSGGTFWVTGADGLPQQPDERAANPYATGEVRSLPVDPPSQPWKLGDPIVELQGLYQLHDIRWVMSRTCD